MGPAPTKSQVQYLNKYLTKTVRSINKRICISIKTVLLATCYRFNVNSVNVNEVNDVNERERDVTGTNVIARTPSRVSTFVRCLGLGLSACSHVHFRWHGWRGGISAVLIVFFDHLSITCPTCRFTPTSNVSYISYLVSPSMVVSPPRCDG